MNTKNYISALILALLFLAGCGGGAGDMSTPEAAFKSFQSAVDSWDLDAMWEGLKESSTDPDEFDDFKDDIGRAKDEIQPCFASAKLGEKTVDEEDKAAYKVEGCEHYESRELRFVKVDGKWKIANF